MFAKLTQKWPWTKRVIHIDTVLLLIVLGMIGWIIQLAATDQPDKATWLLVPVTAIYSVFTLFVAGASIRNAQASLRAAEAMEASVEEARLSRWAAHSGYISLTDRDHYTVSNGAAKIRLTNAFRQPILDLQVFIWRTEEGPSGDREVQYASMLESKMRELSDDEDIVEIELTRSTRAESECRAFGEAALSRFESLSKSRPQHSLCVLRYAHRANMLGSIFVYDLVPVPEEKTDQTKSTTRQKAPES